MQNTLKIRYLRLVRSAFRTLRHRRLRHHRWWKSLTRPLFHRSLWSPCASTVSTGISIGLFFSMMPIPFQMIPTALLAMRFRGNIPFALAACWVSNPLTQAPIIFSQFRLGHWMRDALSVPMPPFLTKVDYSLPGIGPLNAASFTLGFITSGVILAVIAYPIVHLVFTLLPKSIREGKKRHPRNSPHDETPFVP